ncbi:lysophospholipase L1-like esterase [Kroppenstedtia sanguinis]|uniref:SGNH/GDSL hydrolase family protein n=1 Tax=Kroppenstedtia sanguinis TaxID=1380684 RepID=A0ABW4CA40_9BACL
MKKILIGVAALIWGIWAAFHWDAQEEAEAVKPEPPWMGVWMASHQEPSGEALKGVENRTLRQIIHPHLDGKKVRIRLSNQFGQQPVTFQDIYIGKVEEGAALLPHTNNRVTFGGKESVTIEPGMTAHSDPLRFQVKAGEDLAVSLYVPGESGPISWHRLAKQRSYISGPGNYATQTEPGAFTQSIQAWYWLTGIDVIPHPQTTGGIVTLGDSITDGAGSTHSTNYRYPDILSVRLRQEGIRMSVMNAGISGNKIRRDDPVYGPSALSRLERDVLRQPGVTDVILLEGINDIGHPPSDDAEHIIAGLKQIIAQAHKRGLNIYGGTLLPYKGAYYYTEEGNVQRKKVNEWIRTSGAFDGVFDFERILRDPADPDRLHPAYDSGDHLHPNDAGYRAMAETVNLDRFHPDSQVQVY